MSTSSPVQGRIQEFFIEGRVGVQTLVQKRLLNFFVANYHVIMFFSICEAGRLARESALRAEANRSWEGTQKQLGTFFNVPGI